MLSYLTKKVFNLARMRRLKPFEKKPGIFIKTPYRTGQRICLYLANPTYMHPGDHLFFEPLLRLLHQAGLPISVMPSPVMKDYFKANGYTIADDLTDIDFVISRPEMLPEFQQPWALINTACPSIPTRLSNYLVKTFAELFNVTMPEDFDYRPSQYPSEPSIDLSQFDNGEFYLFNNYVESGKFRINNKKRQRLIDFAKDKPCIYVGSNATRKTIIAPMTLLKLICAGKPRSPIYFIWLLTPTSNMRLRLTMSSCT